MVLCPHGAVYGLTQGLGRQNREKEPELVVAARQGREKPEKITTKEGPRTGLRTSGKTDNTPAWPNLHRTGPGGEKHINRGAKARSLALSPARWGALLVSSDQRALTPRRWISLLSSK